jgi:2-polyprenyl-3-methyl-5-hydroxy-6-metoxy-1,4-benzoquinol methylase
MTHSSDAEWEALGRTDPYWAVITDDAFRRENLSEENRRRFLETGERYVTRLWATCRRHIDDGFAPRHVLDFGCGVGRVAVALAKRCETVVGVDVSQGMLSEARLLCDDVGAKNIQLVRSDDTLASVTGPFDLVHCLLVLQHVPVRRGLQLTRRLIELAGPDGVVVLHVLYHHPFMSHPWSGILTSVTRSLRRLYRRAPEMEMNPYPLDDLFGVVQDARVRRLHAELTDHGGCRGVILFFKKGLGDEPLA